MGAGARTLFHTRLGPALRYRAGVERSRRAGEGRWRAVCALRQGRLHLHRLRLVPGAARRRARRVQTVRESGFGEVSSRFTVPGSQEEGGTDNRELRTENIRWRRLYIFVLAELAIAIGIFYAFTKAFQ